MTFSGERREQRAAARRAAARCCGARARAGSARPRRAAGRRAAPRAGTSRRAAPRRGAESLRPRASSVSRSSAVIGWPASTMTWPCWTRLRTGATAAAASSRACCGQRLAVRASWRRAAGDELGRQRALVGREAAPGSRLPRNWRCVARSVSRSSVRWTSSRTRAISVRTTRQRSGVSVASVVRARLGQRRAACSGAGPARSTGLRSAANAASTARDRLRERRALLRGDRRPRVPACSRTAAGPPWRRRSRASVGQDLALVGQRPRRADAVLRDRPDLEPEAARGDVDREDRRRARRSGARPRRAAGRRRGA